LPELAIKIGLPVVEPRHIGLLEIRADGYTSVQYQHHPDSERFGNALFLSRVHSKRPGID
jgi:hypothetical protein